MNAKFSEYATSGALTVALSRNQISALALVQGGAADWTHTSVEALVRKGLVEAFANPSVDAPDRVEYRATAAGLLVMGLVREAGLSNEFDGDQVAAELASLRAALSAARMAEVNAKRFARAALARKELAEARLDDARREANGDKMALRILLRDPLPEWSDADLLTAVGSHL